MATGKTYADVAVDYDKIDPFKRMALELFEPTLTYPERLGIRILRSSGGLTASVFDVETRGRPRMRLALNLEGLGTKNLIADELHAKRDVADAAYAQLGLAGYRCVGQDTAAMSVIDLGAVGADPFIYGDIIAVATDKWFEDMDRSRALLQGYRDAADIGRFAIPLGETPVLRDVIVLGTADLAGASVGLINPADRYTTGSKITEGDAIFGLSAPGPNANGISKIRKMAAAMKEGYLTKMSDSRTLAEGVLVPTPIYARPVIDMFDAGVDVHGLQPITGHGWSKIARPKEDWTYAVKNVPEPPLVFRELVKWGPELRFENEPFETGPKENYFVWNMGIGFVVIAPHEFEETVRECAMKYGIETHYLGKVAKGERKVIMEPFGFAYTPK